MDWLRWTLLVLVTLFACLTAAHALTTKRDSRAALGWVAVCLMFPFAGPVLYFFFGINRVRTRAQEMRARHLFSYGEVYDPAWAPEEAHPTDPPLEPELADVARLGSTVGRRPLVEGNAVDILRAGEECYPAMLRAIDEAREALYLATYIFETNATGRRFIDALAAATARGVDVRIVLDGVGEMYSWPHAGRLLRRRGVRVVRFLPPKLFPPTLNINLRNHRKILVADGKVAFTGGMNIGDRHLAANEENRSRVIDAHFMLRGPIVAQIEGAFLEDWYFLTGEVPRSRFELPPCAGSALCRTIVDGPNEDMDKLQTILTGVVSLARRRVWIMTPYFLPPAGLVAAMQAAALRGVDVCIILPEHNNLPYVAWATRNMLWELLQRGVRVCYQPGPFVHTKLLLMDDGYVQIGSANLDPRSLRLNFELVVEVYDRTFAATISSTMEATRRMSREVTLAELAARPFGERMRDAAAWLFSPYL